MNFSQVKAISIPEGAVKQITDGLGRVLWKVASEPSVDYTIPLYIEAPADSPNSSGWDISLPCFYVYGAHNIEYSFDRVTWTPVTLQSGYGDHANPVCHIDKGQRVYLRGSNVSWSSNSYYNFKLKIVSEGHFSGIKIGGNIMSTLYGENFTGDERSFPAGSSYTFANFFYNSGPDALTISDVSELLLPATTLVRGCYYGMFQSCSSLTQAPTLPATTLVSECYYNMFQSCSSLTQAPTLPATTLAQSCYSQMFYGCSSLTTTPALPATTLASSCYSSMFGGCSSLTQAPTLPATTLASSCYSGMFDSCTSLTTAPALPATTLYNQCYYQMFSNCVALTTAPALPATTLAQSCYQGMFNGCSSLTQAPALPATTLADSCYYEMFSYCPGLTQAPALPATTLYNQCYYSMFQNCSSLTQAPVLPATTLVSGCYTNMFNGCSDLNYIKCLATEDANYTYDFRSCCENWVYGVSSSGTFIASDNYSSGWYWGNSGVPENWEHQTESGIYFEPANEGGGGGTQIAQFNGFTMYEMGGEQGGYPVEADWRNMMVPGFNGNDYCFAMMKISADQGGSGGVWMTPYLGNGVTVYISYEVMDDGTCPFSYNSDDEYDYEYSLTNSDDGNQITPGIDSGNCRWVKFIKNQGTYEGNTPYISIDS